MEGVGAGRLGILLRIEDQGGAIARIDHGCLRPGGVPGAAIAARRTGAPVVGVVEGLLGGGVGQEGQGLAVLAQAVGPAAQAVARIAIGV